MEFKGTVTVGVIGKTNAGKSTFVNKIVGEKISIVTQKRQTTRENILGILNLEDCQIVFVDTPGIHKTVDNMGKLMMKQVRSVKDSVDVIIYIIDGTKYFDKSEYENVEKMTENGDVILCISKIDIAGFEKVYPLIDKYKNITNLVDIVPISAVADKNIDVIINLLKERLVKVDESQLYYERDVYTDKSVSFMCAEIVREKVLLNLDEEIPYGVIVEVIRFNEKSKIVEIDIDILAKKQSHKSIIIGKQGLKLKQISTQSRIDIEKLLGKKVMLKIYVAVRD